MTIFNPHHPPSSLAALATAPCLAQVRVGGHLRVVLPRDAGVLGVTVDHLSGTGAVLLPGSAAATDEFVGLLMSLLGAVTFVDQVISSDINR